MRRLLVFFALLLTTAPAFASDATTDMLNAPRVKEFITLSSGPGNDSKPLVKYTTDQHTSPKAANGVLLRSQNEVAIHIQNFNPLTQVWVVESKATPDVSFAAITAFFDDLKGLQGSFGLADTDDSVSDLADLRFLQPAGATQSKPQPANCDALKKLILRAYGALKQAAPVAEFQQAVAEATGRSGVISARTKLLAEQASIQDDITSARALLTQIRTQYGALDKNKPTGSCSVVTGQILVDYVEVRSTADRILAAKENLAQQLGNLAKTLDPLVDQGVWYGPSSSDYVIKTVTPTFAEQQGVTATVKTRSVKLDNGSIVISSDDTNVVSATLVVRKSSFFVAERAAAIVYNSLTYPQYGTAKNAAGDTVVQRTADHRPINGALMLNLVMRTGRDSSVAYPFLQLGVSSAKDFPGFLAGLGLRFADPFNFSISVGGLITRYKDLDGDLKVGDAVTGTDDINQHLTYKTSPVVLYGAVQLKF
jgi:hypothetical protein